MRGHTRISARGAGILFLFLSFWTGCATSARLTTQAAGKGEVEMEKIYSRQYSGIEQALRMVVRTQDDWRTIWSRIVRNQMPQPEPPEIDFSKSALIVAAMGQRNSGGYSIDVTGAEFREGRLEATVLETSPGRGCIVTQALTSPVVVVRIPAGIQPVSFIEEKRTTSCR